MPVPWRVVWACRAVPIRTRRSKATPCGHAGAATIADRRPSPAGPDHLRNGNGPILRLDRCEADAVARLRPPPSPSRARTVGAPEPDRAGRIPIVPVKRPAARSIDRDYLPTECSTRWHGRRDDPAFLRTQHASNARQAEPARPEDFSPD